MTHIQNRQPKPVDPEINAQDAAAEVNEPRTPTWFTRDLSEHIGEDLAERYRSSRPESRLIVETPGPEAYEDFRRKLDEKFSQPQRPYDVPPVSGPSERRPTLALSDIHGQRRRYEQEQRAHVKQKLAHEQSVPWFKIIGYSMVAICIGGASGFGFANREKLATLFSSTRDQAHVLVANLLPTEVKLPSMTNETVIPKKAVQMASLDVNDVRGTLNSMIPLMLNAQATEGGAPVALKIMGLPSDAYLTAGKEVTKGNWLVKPSDISGVKLVVPLQLESNQFNMEIAAVEEKTGELASPIKAMNVTVDPPSVAATQTADGKQELNMNNIAATIAPASAPPANAGSSQITAPIPEAIPEASALISKADGLLNEGDIVSARQLYMRANGLGDAKGAYGVGRTYDPQVFAALKVDGLKPDAAKAAEWYATASKSGVVAAKTALSNLQAAQP